jgi:Protein of unknown function (DUF1552)
MKAINHLSRRHLLQGAAGATLALPLLSSLLPRDARADAASAGKALIVLKSFSTQVIKEWYPRFTGNGYVLKDSRYGGTSKADGTTLLTQDLVAGLPYKAARLRDFQTATGISGILGASLNPYLDKLNLIRGLDFLPSVNHNYGGILGNYGSCTQSTPCDADKLPDVPTIDQVIAYSSKFYGTPPGLRSLQLSQGVEDSISFSNLGQAGGPVSQLKARTNPRDAFNDVFGAYKPGPAGQGRDRDKLLIDRVIEDYKRLKASPRLSAADRQLLDQYLTLITELQARLAAKPSMACTPPAMPQSLPNSSGTDASDIKTKWSLMLDLVTAAVMCGQTRVITIGVHKALGPGPDANNPALVGHFHSDDAGGATWHGLAHDFGNPNARRMLKGINAWIADEVFAKLCGKLDVQTGAGGTYLDKSLIYWGNEMGFNHIGYSVPCLLAGSAGGFLKTGRYLDYIDWEGRAFFSQEDGNVIKGIPHNQLLVTILQAMGLAPADYETGGQKGYGSTSTSGRDPTLWPVNYDMATVGNVLPGIVA